VSKQFQSLTQNERRTEIFRVLIQERGYFVFRFDYAVRPGTIFKRFRTGEPLPQPFVVLAPTDRADWRAQQYLAQKLFNFKYTPVPNPGKFFMRCLTD
jgi:hypothetical protein